MKARILIVLVLVLALALALAGWAQEPVLNMSSSGARRGQVIMAEPNGPHWGWPAFGADGWIQFYSNGTNRAISSLSVNVNNGVLSPGGINTPGDVIAAGIFEGDGSALNTLNLRVSTNGTEVGTIVTNWMFWAGTNVVLQATNRNGLVDVRINAAGGSGSPPGSDTQVPFNDGGVWGADDGLTFNKITDQLSVGVGGIVTGGAIAGGAAGITTAGDVTIDGNFVGSGSGLTSLNASALTSGTVPDARLHGANPIFSGLTVTGATPGLILVTNPASASYVKIGTNDSIFGTNGGLAGMSYTLTNGGATFSSNVVAAKFFGDGSALTGISGGGGANYYSGDYYLGEFMENATPFGRYIFTANSGSILPVTTPLDTTHFGVVQLSTSSSATAAPVLTTAQPGAFLPGSGYTLTNSWWLRLEDLSTGAENYQLRAGFSDSTTSAEPTDAVMFRYSSDTNSGNWQLVTRAVGAESVSNTVSAVSADTWYKLTVEVNSTSTLASFYVNDTLVGTLASNIPDVDSSVNRCFGSVLQMVKAVGTTARICYVDAVTYAVNGPARTP